MKVVSFCSAKLPFLSLMSTSSREQHEPASRLFAPAYKINPQDECDNALNPLIGRAKMLSRLMRYIRVDAIPNTGSVARDLLASERTFLAWARTGLGFIALGVALEKVEAFAALSPTLLHLSNSRTKLAAGVLVGSRSL